MISILFRLLLTLGALWYQRRQRYAIGIVKLTAFWSGISVILTLIETGISERRLFSGLFFQGLIITLFYVPPVFFAFLWARKFRKSLWGPFLLFLILSLLSSVIAGIFLANATFVTGLVV